VAEAAAVVAAPAPALAAFAEDQSAELRDRIFDEFNSLAVILRAPSATFVPPAPHAPLAEEPAAGPAVRNPPAPQTRARAPARAPRPPLPRALSAPCVWLAHAGLPGAAARRARHSLRRRQHARPPQAVGVAAVCACLASGGRPARPRMCRATARLTRAARQAASAAPAAAGVDEGSALLSAQEQEDSLIDVSANSSPGARAALEGVGQLFAQRGHQQSSQPTHGDGCAQRRARWGARAPWRLSPVPATALRTARAGVLPPLRSNARCCCVGWCAKVHTGRRRSSQAAVRNKVAEHALL